MSTPITEQAPAWFSDPERYCPTWCTRGHAEAFAEGCTLEWASRHTSTDAGGVIEELRNPIDGRVTRRGGGGWDAQLLQQVGENPWKGQGGHVVVELTTRTMSDDGHFDGVTLDLTTGEARTLGAQLLRFADLHDLRGQPRP